MVRLKSNIAALQAQRRLNQVGESLVKNFERLSTGQRINRASDDAAGLSIASALNASSRVFTQAARNLNDGISFYSIAEGAVGQLKNILLRQRELATQSSNGTYSQVQRDAMHAELVQLSQEYNRVIDGAEFNGRSIFDREAGGLALQAGFGDESVLSGDIESAEARTQGFVQRVNVTPEGAPAPGEFNGPPHRLSLSADGRYAVFDSWSGGLVENDPGTPGIYIRDLWTQTTERMETGRPGEEPDGFAYRPSISADGRYVVFNSAATNLIEGMTTSGNQTFVRDLVTGTTELISANDQGEPGDGSSSDASISGDGRYVVFVSDATNLAPGDSNGTFDVFVRDRLANTTRIVSTNGLGEAANSASSIATISDDGRYVLFSSAGTDLVNGYGDGVTGQVYVRDMWTGTTEIVSVNDAGEEANLGASGSLSADGRHVVLRSEATNLVSGHGDGSTSLVYFRDLTSQTTAMASVNAMGVDVEGTAASISGDGRYVTFQSTSPVVLDGDSNGQADIFIRDMETGEVALVSRNTAGTYPNNFSDSPVISRDGRHIIFDSWATDFDSGDENGRFDRFVGGNPLMNWSQVSRSQWLSVKTREDALFAQGKIDAMLSELNTVQGHIGSFTSRVSAALANLNSMNDNYQAAASRIVDVDIADESSQLVRNSVLQQVAQAVLAQANQAPALALSLLQ